MKALFYLNKYFWKYRIRLVLGIVFIFAFAFFSQLPVVLLGDGIDYADEAIRKGLPRDSVMNELLWYGLQIIGLTLLSGVFLFFNRQTIIVMSRLVEYDLKNEIYEHYQKLDLGFYKRNNTGDLMNRISEDVGRVRMYVGPVVMYMTTTIVSLVTTIAFMLHKDVRLTLYVLAPLPLLAVSIYVVSNYINKRSLRVQNQLSQLSTSAQETFSGIRVVKAFAREDKTQENWKNESETYMGLNMKLAGTEALFFPFIQLMIGLSIVLTIYIGGTEAIAGDVSKGTISSFVLNVIRLTWPIASLGWVTSLVQRAAASQERINEFLKTKSDITSPTSEPLKIKGRIEFKNVTFTYPDSGIVALKNVSFTVEPGQSLALIGKTGSGKSTVAGLICRLYDTQQGEVLVDGKDIRTVNLHDLRGQTGYVPQEVFLFSDTVAGNIAFSYADPSELEKHREQIYQAARDAAIYNNIMEFKDQFETMVGERGVTLSGGQKQRISIARAIIRHPQILLFDDCLSAVDTETEDEILGNLRRIMKDKTTIIISHRVSSVQQADQILVVDDGTIAESGTHAQLMDRKGMYYELYQKQALESPKEL